MEHKKIAGQETSAFNSESILATLEETCPAESLTAESFNRTWRDRAICASYNNYDAFFEKDPYGSTKIICFVCPVKRECVIWALMYNEEGVWGGTREDERAEFINSHSDYISALNSRAIALDKFFPRPKISEILELAGLRNFFR